MGYRTPLSLLLVICQVSHDVIVYEDSYCSMTRCLTFDTRTECQMKKTLTKGINNITLQWTTTTWAGSLLSQESIDLMILQDRLDQILKVFLQCSRTREGIFGSD